MNFILEYSAVLVCIFFSYALYFYFYRTRNFSYWKIRNVPYIKPIFPFGSVTDLALAKMCIGEIYGRMYNAFSNERFFGIIDMQHPVLILRDPNLIKAVLTNDFAHFAARTNLQVDKKEFMLRHCSNMQGQEWKEMRALLGSAFTSEKTKNMYELMLKCSDCLKDHISKLIERDSQVEITDLMARFTMDMIATTALGFEINSIDNPSCKIFVTMGIMLRTSKFRFLKRVLTTFLPSLAKLFSLKLIPTEITKLLTKAIAENVKYREENDIRRSDFLDSLINTRKCVTSVKEKGNRLLSSQEVVKTALSVEQITAQVYSVFIAEYATIASNLTFCLFELARHQVIQETLLRDINQALDKHGGKMTYQAIQDMTYLEQVVHETMRLYGSGQTLTRICTKTYKIPNSDVTLERGIRVLIPIYSLHHDPKYFPDPNSFHPERFSTENVKAMHPYVYLPFGKGPRNCVARNFGLLQIKLGIATVISNFQVNLSPGQHIPIEIDKRSFVVTPAQPVILRLMRRKNN